MIFKSIVFATFTFFIFVFNAQAESDFLTTKNTHAGMNQYKADFILPNYDSFAVAKAFIGIDSRADDVTNPGIKGRARKFENNVKTQLSEALQQQTIVMVAKAFPLEPTEKISTGTLVVRPSILGLEVGLGGRKKLSNDDNIVVNIEVINVLDGKVVASASSNEKLKRKDLFSGDNLRTSKANKEASRLAETLSYMLISLLESIENLEQ